MLITAFDAYLTPISRGAVSLVHKSVNLKEPYNEPYSVKKGFCKFSPLFVASTFQIYINKPGLDQREGNWIWINLWNLLTINFKENSQIYSVHITGKCICETPLPLYDLIISTHVKHPAHKFAQKNLCHAKLFKKKVPHILRGGEDILCFIFISFLISKSLW